jgi:hypothetical protein
MAESEGELGAKTTADFQPHDLPQCTSTLHHTGGLSGDGVAGLEILGSAVSLVCLTTN